MWCVEKTYGFKCICWEDAFLYNVVSNFNEYKIVFYFTIIAFNWLNCRQLREIRLNCSSRKVVRFIVLKLLPCCLPVPFLSNLNTYSFGSSLQIKKFLPGNSQSLETMRSSCCGCGWYFYDAKSSADCFRESISWILLWSVFALLRFLLFRLISLDCEKDFSRFKFFPASGYLNVYRYTYELF